MACTRPLRFLIIKIYTILTVLKKYYQAESVIKNGFQIWASHCVSLVLKQTYKGQSDRKTLNAINKR